ncbi:16S rRNA (adenine(1518)-N(6)/adenine(1519)-N(6))-dimethyltransferase RsmA [Deinococcus peraridilitoris]|uniref:Ribosomal RNA small subunit methyltransferase A n=1 Tax=Deinococcus peraridilitoris (strain DSM 19664 / LMG 22246 / CIP 109416 / KR-200) TaxID=937777 RepID=L0A5A2_DEIPD|nr:16S rRNA (adenine(1518)-N(6)/adenine(1519)-N(6))-dimethyltransferase RsmA [Deinococcus peraridilitoris]AFZ68362.1 dimethyladenosine transferase [Deinococcus peraridilitoris DSM 19664]
MTDPVPLYSPKTVRDLLARHGLRPTKSLGQNFLVDGNVLRAIAEAGGAKPGESVVEVGPGLGVLTREMALRGAHVTALEKDERLRPVLQETLSGLDVRVVWGDALKFDYQSVPEGSRVIANLPYYISTALLTRFMESGRFASATVLVQREVGERLAARPGSDGYGFLSAIASLYGSVRLLRDVPKGAFFPAPDVTSSVVRLDFSGQKPDVRLVRLLEAALHHRRKTLRNNLRMAGYEGGAIEQALNASGLRPDVRAEDVPLDVFFNFAQELGVLG